MFHRTANPLKTNSFFIFGARGTGKSTFLREYFKDSKALWIDLLDTATEDRLSLRPDLLKDQITALSEPTEWVIIDEIQKVPRLLDVVHSLIERTSIKFAMTGSSAGKLKKGSANLLAGRAFMYHLFPLTCQEIGPLFDLVSALQWGTLPRVVNLPSSQEKQKYLQTYAHTYLKEEIWAEHIVRKLEPFRRFLEIAAQVNGEILNFTNIARDIGADTKTVQSYFQILDDTLIGFLLEPFDTSIRKRQRKSPKFYFFDTGVKRALEHSLTQSILPQTYGFGKLFEHFVIVEILRLNSYLEKDFRFSYFRTTEGMEIDLVIERPGAPLALVEIKSAEKVDERDTKTLNHFLKDFPKAQAYCLSRDPISQKIGNVTCLPWEKGMSEIGLG